MKAVNLRSFKQQVIRYKRKMRGFLTRLENNPPRKLDALAEELDKEVWQEVDCLSCANCCKKMTPNMCGIYEIRPADCSGFPHLTRKKMTDYMEWHKQNVEYCPATFKLVEKMMDRVNAAKK